MTPTVSPLAAELPVPLTHFVGRERELDDLARLLAGTRLLTLTGAGGSGKTRLAREAAARVAGEFGRVAWTDLSPLCDGALIAQEVAASLHLPERAGVTPLERVVAEICEVRTLLVLDNCEHLVDACAELAEQLLRGCPRLVILATSREALGVAGETAWLVPPLAGVEAAQLFVERAKSSCPSFAPTNAAAIDEICRRLDGIPLAIELAAARVRVLTPEQIASRLDDAFRLLTAGSRTALPRHRTLRATMEWSYALLAAREQALLRRLAVFAGSFALDAAEAVCAGDPLEPEDILDGVSALVDKSLVVMEAGESIARYRLLETVRQYAHERLAEAGELDALRLKHAEYFLGVIEETEPHLFGGEDEPGLIARLARDNDNLRAATAWATADASRASHALRLAGALFWYWYGSAMLFPGGQFAEGRRVVEAALRVGAAGEPRLRARALTSCGLIALATGEYEEATRAFGEALALVRGTDPAHEALLLAKKGATRLMAGDVDRASALLEQASALVEPMPRSMLHAFVWFWHGWTALARGDLATARTLGDHHIALGHALGHRTIRGHSHTVYGRVELSDGRREAAYEHFAAALPYHLDLADAWGIMLDVEGFAAIACERHRHADAARLLGASDMVRERTLLAIPATERAQREQRLATLRAALGGAELERLLGEGRALSMEEVVRLTGYDTIGHTAEFRVAVPEEAPVAAGAPAVHAAARPRLQVLALGPLQVYVGDRLVEQAAWGSARPRELLIYLLMHPEGRTKEQAGLAFWPDASPTQLRNNFHVTLHRLRKALGNAEWVQLTGDRYRIDPQAVAGFDVVEFEQEVTSARLALKRQQEGAAQRLEQAVARYRGDFLDGEPVGDWHLEYRDRLQRIYVDSLMELGSGLLREERHDRAAEAYRRVLARDELHEDALVALMRCHAGLGERSQALRAYKRFADRLKQELAAEPGREAARFYERLQQGPVA